VRYRALVGLDVPENEYETARIIEAARNKAALPPEERRMVRFEAGDILDYVPETSIPWLTEQHAIEEYDGRSPRRSEGQFIWAEDSDVYHDRARLTEECNTDDIEAPRFGHVFPEGRRLCAHCEANEFDAFPMNEEETND
jgi:hypothetical protein